jgi:hypothetical protein
MGWIPLILAVLQLIIRIWDALKEKNVEKKKQQTEALQSGVRAIVDRDASRLNSVILELDRLRK